MNQLYPIFLKLAGRPCLVVGGGVVGERKVESLLEAGARVTVVSPELTPGLARRAGEGQVRWVSRRYRPGDLEGMSLVFSAVDDRQVSAEVHEEAGSRGIPVNAVDHDPHCTFHVPAMVVRGDLKIAISTGGKSPALAGELKARISSVIDEDLVRFVAALGALRPRVLARYPLERRGRILKALARSIRPAGVAPIPGPETASPGRAGRGKVYLVGAGPGDPGLLTLRGLELLQTADEVHHDRLVGPRVLALIPPEVSRIFVGKEVGSERPDTGEILVQAARAGKAVVRLKGGDPNVFGRGGEEMLALLKADVPFEVVPGVSALTAVPAAAGIPITFRGLAREVVVRSGYHRPDPFDGALAGRPSDQTTYVYFMTIGRLQEIVDELLAEGLDPSTPAAIVQRGTLPDQRTLIATLGGLPARAGEEDLKAPAMVIVGEVVRIARWKENMDLLDACLMGGVARPDE